jgi:hypothetical protein
MTIVSVGGITFARQPIGPAVQETPLIPSDQLDSLVAPVALYPDPLLSQTLVASTYPLEIMQLQQWLDNNNLKDKALTDAVSKQPWDPSIQAMAALQSTNESYPTANKINLPALQPGSSIMPGKVNPVTPELMNIVAFRVMGNDHSATLAAHSGPLQLNAYEPLEGFAVLESQALLYSTSSAFPTRCIDGITVDEMTLDHYMETMVRIVTALNPVLGYEKATELTCDPVAGYVQAPCIERCAYGPVKSWIGYSIASEEIPEQRRVGSRYGDRRHGADRQRDEHQVQRNV